jgi:hypothetical protein
MYYAQILTHFEAFGEKQKIVKAITVSIPLCIILFEILKMF